MIKIKHKPGSGELMIKKLSMYDTEYFFKEKNTMTYVSYGQEAFSFAEPSAFNEGTFLFRLVKMDFDKWIEKNPNPEFTERYRLEIESDLNKKYEGERYSYDINHAYWRIAFINDYISENTYEHGLTLKDKNSALKQLYCMALSVRGQNRSLDGYIGMKKTGNKRIVSGDELHRTIYTDIRNKTYKIMDEIAHRLGNDFIEYKVDCITFKNKDNCEVVERMLTEENVMFKKVI